MYTTAGVLAEPEIGKAGDLDMAIVTLRFKNGAIGTIDNSRKAVFGYDQRVEILGTKGKIASENRFPNEVVVSTGESIYSDRPLEFFMDRYPESFALELKMFVEAVLEGKQTPVTGADGRAPVVMALAAKKSFDEHRPVKLAEVSA
jgi:myo-inositol 2-dehydrogenase/D-chiro-inositol 1-dehydrogenase